MTLDIFSDIPIIWQLPSNCRGEVGAGGVGVGVIFLLLPIDEDEVLPALEFFTLGLSMHIIPLLDDLTR